MQSFMSLNIHIKCYNFKYKVFVQLLRVNNTNKKVGAPCSFLRNTMTKGKFRLQTIIIREGTEASSKMVDHTHESCAFFCYFRSFILCNKSSTVKGITRVIREVDKSNLANFDIAMLCAVGYAQCKTRELP